jgi:hypothetical protein
VDDSYAEDLIGAPQQGVVNTPAIEPTRSRS